MVSDLDCPSLRDVTGVRDASILCRRRFPPTGNCPRPYRSTCTRNHIRLATATGEELAVLWLTVLTLPDDSRVESNLQDVESADPGLAARAYRLRLADGSVHEFPTLTSILGHLGDHYDPDDLSRAAGSHPTLTADLASGCHVTGVDLASTQA